jgi:hypothetical protein
MQEYAELIEMGVGDNHGAHRGSGTHRAMAERSARYQITTLAMLLTVAGALMGEKLAEWALGHTDPGGVMLAVVLLAVALLGFLRAVWKRQE